MSGKRTFTDRDILQEARRRAACLTKYPLNKENILKGRWDDKAPVIRARRQVEREIALAAVEGIRPIVDEEDEPCFAEIEKRAEARLAELGDEGDGPLVRELLAAMRHYEAENHALYWQMSDNGELVGTEP